MFNPWCSLHFVLFFQPSKICGQEKFYTHPPLLPGEQIISQQDHVTCVDTFDDITEGVLHITTYRVIFAGSHMKVDTLFLGSISHHYKKVANVVWKKTIDNSFIEEREILMRVFSGYRRWNRVEKEEYTCSISFLISLLVVMQVDIHEWWVTNKFMLWQACSIIHFNPLALKISLVILSIVYHIIFIVLVWRIWYWIN